MEITEEMTDEQIDLQIIDILKKYNDKLDLEPDLNFAIGYAIGSIIKNQKLTKENELLQKRIKCINEDYDLVVSEWKKTISQINEINKELEAYLGKND